MHSFEQNSNHTNWRIRTGFDGYTVRINPNNQSHVLAQNQFKTHSYNTDFSSSPLSTILSNGMTLFPRPMEFGMNSNRFYHLDNVIAKKIHCWTDNLLPNIAYPNSIWNYDFQANHNFCTINDYSGISAIEASGNTIYVSMGDPTFDFDYQAIINAGCPPINSSNQAQFYCPQPGACLEKKLFFSGDGGTSFIDITWTMEVGAFFTHSDNTTTVTNGPGGPIRNPITDIEIDKNDGNRFWVSFGGFNDLSPRKTRVYEGRLHKNINISDSDFSDSYVEWKEISANLPEFPVNCLAFQKGGSLFEGILYAGTEVGIFYYDYNETNPQWECFSHQLPVIPITDLEINYCAGKIRASTLGRGMWESPTRKQPLIEILAVNNGSSQNEITTPTTILRDIKVKTGAIFTVTSTLEMGGFKKIYVEKGATLIINGGTVTGACGSLWGGIEIYGSPNLPQSGQATILDPCQGTVFMENNATIELARLGITTSNASNWGEFGGRIFASNSTFLNNRKCIEFMEYPDQNVSRFQNCHFLCDAPLPDPAFFDLYGNPRGTGQFVSLWSVHGVRFSQCKFENTYPGFIPENRPSGIFSEDASYFVEGTCTTSTLIGCGGNFSGYIPGKFLNLKNGIEFNSLNGSGFVSIKGNEFDNIHTNISIINGLPSVIKDNWIHNIPDWHFGYEVLASTGIWIIGNGGSTISNNLIHSIGTILTQPRGIYARNTGSAGLNVYRNSFSGVMEAIQCEDDNSAIEIKCNTFGQDVHFAIVVSSGLFNDQGTCSNDPASPAGNEFHNPCGFHIFCDANVNSGSGFDYSHHSVPPSPAYLKPDINCTSNNVQLNNCGNNIYEDGVSCPVELNAGNGTISGFMALENAIQDLEAEVDQNDLNGISEYINPNAGHSNGAIIAFARDHYPLSDSALIMIIQRQPRLGWGVLRNILVENSGLSNAVMAAVNFILPQMPIPLQNDIVSAQTIYPSIMEDLQNRIKKEKQNYRWKRNNMIQNFKILNRMDSAEIYLDSLNNPEDLFLRIQINIELGHFAEALANLELLPSTPENLQFKFIMQNVIPTLQNGVNYNISPSFKNELHSIANAEGKNSHIAKAILGFGTGKRFNYLPEPFSEESEKRNLNSDKGISFQKHDDLLPFLYDCYPNPFRDETFIPYFVPEGSFKEVSIVIIDPSGGRIVQKYEGKIGQKDVLTFDSKNLPQGLYYYALLVDGLVFSPKKLVILR